MQKNNTKACFKTCFGEEDIKESIDLIKIRKNIYENILKIKVHYLFYGTIFLFKKLLQNHFNSKSYNKTFVLLNKFFNFNICRRLMKY